MDKTHKDELMTVVKDIIKSVPDESLAVVTSMLKSFLKYYRREGNKQ